MEGDELRRRRQALGLTQKQLADLLGVDVTSVARWERGEVGVNPLMDLALKQIEAHPTSKKKKGELPNTKASVSEPKDPLAKFILAGHLVEEPEFVFKPRLRKPYRGRCWAGVRGPEAEEFNRLMIAWRKYKAGE